MTSLTIKDIAHTEDLSAKALTAVAGFSDLERDRYGGTREPRSRLMQRAR